MKILDKKFSKHLVNILFGIIILIAFVYLTNDSNDSDNGKVEVVSKINTELKSDPLASSNSVLGNSLIGTNPEYPNPEIKDKPPAEINNQNIENQTSSGFEQNIAPTNSGQALNESLNQIQGETVTTEAIIERNAYFKKLSDQLKELQGSVSTDSTGDTSSNNSQNNIEDLSDETEADQVYDLDDEDVVEDPNAPPSNEDLQKMLDEAPE